MQARFEYESALIPQESYAFILLAIWNGSWGKLK